MNRSGNNPRQPFESKTFSQEIVVLRLGLIGCGQLGGAIGRALLRSGLVASETLSIANRSGSRAGFEDYPGIVWTTDLQSLTDASDIILLALPPAAVPGIRFTAPEKLIVSVMAGIDSSRLAAMSGSSRVVRAMSNPAAEIGLAYSPFYVAPGVTDEDRSLVRRLFEACGTTDEVPYEDQIEMFTAVTGPVPGFVAFFAEAMVDYLVARDVDPAIADRAVRQLFLASGRLLAEQQQTPAEQVQAMIDYAGTTAAGLNVLKSGDVTRLIAEGLDAARERTRTIGQASGD